MTSEDREKLINETVRFVLSHYEVGGMPFGVEPVDPNEWWGKVRLLPSPKLLPASSAHFEARIARWQELAQKELSPSEEAA